MERLGEQFGQEPIEYDWQNACHLFAQYDKYWVRNGADSPQHLLYLAVIIAAWSQGLRLVFLEENTPAFRAAHILEASKADFVLDTQVEGSRALYAKQAKHNLTREPACNVVWYDNRQWSTRFDNGGTTRLKLCRHYCRYYFLPCFDRGFRPYVCQEQVLAHLDLDIAEAVISIDAQGVAILWSHEQLQVLLNALFGNTFGGSAALTQPDSDPDANYAQRSETSLQQPLGKQVLRYLQKCMAYLRVCNYSWAALA